MFAPGMSVIATNLVDLDWQFLMMFIVFLMFTGECIIDYYVFQTVFTFQLEENGKSVSLFIYHLVYNSIYSIIDWFYYSKFTAYFE